MNLTDRQLAICLAALRNAQNDESKCEEWTLADAFPEYFDGVPADTVPMDQQIDDVIACLLWDAECAA